jgi:hypothetical protein
MSENKQESNQNTAFGALDGLMLSAKLTATAAAMKWNSDTAAVSFAQMGATLVEAGGLTQEGYAELLSSIPASKIDEAIRWYQAFPELLSPEFQPGENEAVNIAVRKHPDNPAERLLYNVLHSIKNHPEFKE